MPGRCSSTAHGAPSRPRRQRWARRAKRPRALPAPFADMRQPYAGPDDVRLAVAVRLGPEALAPERVELVVEQVVLSTERASGGDAYGEEVIVVARHTLKPYAHTDIAIDALVLPYPFRCVAQSILGIVSYREKELYDERVQSVLAYNAEVDRKQVQSQLVWSAKRTAYDGVDGDARVWNAAIQNRNAVRREEFSRHATLSWKRLPRCATPT